jgi:UDP-N-acetylmuramate: L-alanyl-gamma-D-glutamyl-meso-diaminopimelate ligase
MTAFSFRSIHIIGACGTLMGSFAAYLRRQGFAVSGSDQNIYPPMSDVLKNAGVSLLNGYKAENLDSLDPSRDLIVIGNVISASNPEAMAAKERGFSITSLPEFMEKNLLPSTQNIVVAGTHGKTTTSSLMAHVLRECGEKASWFIGGVSHDLPFSFNVEDAGKYFVLEGDEYDTAFWDKVPKFFHYLPNHVILTSVEFDHADIYKDLDAVETAFRGLFSRHRDGGQFIACTESSSVRKLLAEHAGKKVLTYARRGVAAAEIEVDDIVQGESFQTFTVYRGGKPYTKLKLALPGAHNALNAAAVFVMARELGFTAEFIQEALASFKGVKRRQEERGTVAGVLVIDDFAHHPTAVRETLKALRLKYPKGRMHAVFEPRSATSRRKVFQADYAEAFDAADLVWIATPYDQSKISSAEQFSTDELVSDLNDRGRRAASFDTVPDGVHRIAEIAQPGDTIAVLSNGGFGGFIPLLLEALGNKAPLLQQTGS